MPPHNADQSAAPASPSKPGKMDGPVIKTEEPTVIRFKSSQFQTKILPVKKSVVNDIKREIIIKPKIISQKLLPNEPVKQQKTLSKPALFREIPKPTFVFKESSKGTSKANVGNSQGRLNQAHKDTKNDKSKEQKPSTEAVMSGSKGNQRKTHDEQKPSPAGTSVSSVLLNIKQEPGTGKQGEDHSASRQLTDIVRLAFGSDTRNEQQNKKNNNAQIKSSGSKSAIFNRRRKTDLSNSPDCKDMFDILKECVPLPSESNSALGDFFDPSYFGGVADLDDRSQADFLQRFAFSTSEDTVCSADEDSGNSAVTIPDASMIQSGLQRTFDMAAFQPFLDEAQNSTSGSKEAPQEKTSTGKQPKASCTKAKEQKPDKEKAGTSASKKNKGSSAPVAQRLKLLRQRNFDLMTTQVFNDILQKWEEYLLMSPDEMQYYEMENGHQHNYNADAMTMISDPDLSVWNLINDMGETVNFDVLSSEILQSC